MNNTQTIYIYNGVDEVPEDVSHVRVDPSVVIIPRYAFQCRRKLEEVELPEGLIRIGRFAFANCTRLMRINIPSTLEEIGESVFEKCNKLDGITLPEGLRQLGKYAFYYCNSLKSINIPPNLEDFNEEVNCGTGTFLHCHNLSNVTFSEGIEVIGKDAFCYCRSLVSIELPSSLKVIEVEAFEGCTRLNEVYMPDTIESIEARAFKKSNFTNFRMPSSIGNDVDISIVRNTTSLVSLELPETVERLEDKYEETEEKYTELSVRNIAVPSDCKIAIDLLESCTDLGVAFPNEDNDTISTALKHRFDVLPIHKICYYQSYHDNETTMQSLKREINPWTSNPPGKLNTTGKQQDCLGMTPLHILACSTKPTIAMYRILIDKYPETLIMKDKWGDIPLLYALWCNAPSEVIDLLVDSYKSLHTEYEIDWKGMLETLAKRSVPLSNIQRLINTQTGFSNQEYDMQSVVTALTAHDKQASFNCHFSRITFDETLRYLLGVSITKRLDVLGITKWRVDLENIINAFPGEEDRRKDTERDTQAVYDRLDMYELAKEATSILELALWKHKMGKSTSSSNDKSLGQSNKRARVDIGISERQQYRINCGANIVVRNVLPYLLPE